MGGNDNTLAGSQKMGYGVDDHLGFAFDDLDESVEWRSLFRQSFSAVEGHDAYIAGRFLYDCFDHHRIRDVFNYLNDNV